MPLNITSFSFQEDPKVQVQREYDKNFESVLPNVKSLDFPLITNSPTSQSLFKRYQDPRFGESKYDFGVRASDLENLDYVRANRQSTGAAVLNGFVSRAASIVPKIGAGIGYVGGFMSELGDLGDGFDIGNIIDNSFSIAMQNIDDSLREQLPVYATRQYTEGNLWDKMGTAKFWADDFFDGVAFMASAYAPGGVAAGATKAIAKGILKRGMTKFAEKALNEVPKLFMTAYNTVSEAGFEAYETNKMVRESLAGQINPNTGATYTDDEIKLVAGEAAARTFKANTALLLLSNYVQSSFLLGSPKKESANLIRSIHNGTATPKSILKGMGAAGFEGVLTEGVWEEGMQNAVQQYNKRLVSGMTDDPMLPGVFEEWTHNWVETEGQTSMLLGAILGGGMGIRSGYREAAAYNENLSKLSARWQEAQKSMDLANIVLQENKKGITTADGKIDVNKATERFFFDYFDKFLFDEAAVAVVRGDENHAAYNNAMAAARFAYSFASNSEFVDLAEARKFMNDNLDKNAKELGDDVADNKATIKSLANKALDYYTDATIDFATKKDFTSDSNYALFKNKLRKAAILKRVQIDALKDMRSRLTKPEHIQTADEMIAKEQEVYDTISNKNNIDTLYKQYRELEVTPRDKMIRMTLEYNALTKDKANGQLTPEQEKRMMALAYAIDEHKKKYGKNSINPKNQEMISPSNSMFSIVYDNKDLSTGDLGLAHKTVYDSGAHEIYRNKFEQAKAKFEAGESSVDEYINTVINENNAPYISPDDVAELKDVVKKERRNLILENNALEQEQIDFDNPVTPERSKEIDELSDKLMRRIDKLDSYSAPIQTLESIAGKNKEKIDKLIKVSPEEREINTEEILFNQRIDEKTNPIISEFESNQDAFANESETNEAMNAIKEVDAALDERVTRSYQPTIKKRLIAVVEKLKEMLQVAKNNLMRRLLLDKKLRESERKKLYQSIGIAYDKTKETGNLITYNNVLFSKVESIVGSNELDSILKEAISNGFSEAYIYKIFSIINKSDKKGEFIAELKNVKLSIQSELESLVATISPDWNAELSSMPYSINAFLSNPKGFLSPILKGLLSAGQRVEYKKTTPLEVLQLTRNVNMAEDALLSWRFDNVGSDTFTVEKFKQFLEIFKAIETVDYAQVLANSEVDYEKMIKKEIVILKKLKKENSKVIPSRQQVNAVRQFVTWFYDKSNEEKASEDAINESTGKPLATKGANSLKLWANLKGVAGTGKSTLAKWIIDILGLTKGQVYVTSSNEVLSENISRITEVEKGKKLSDIKVEDISDNVKLLIIDEVETLSFTPEIKDFIDTVLLEINKKRKEKGIAPLRILSLGDPTQITSSAGESTFDAKGYSLANIYHISPLLVPFRSTVGFINSFGDVFRSNKNEVKGLTAKASSAAYTESPKGVHAFSNIDNLAKQFEASKNNGRKKVVIYNNQDALEELKKRFPNAEFVYYLNAPGFTYEEVYLILEHSLFPDEFTYNTAVYTLINRASDYVATLDYTQTFQNIVEQDTGQFIAAFEKEKLENAEEYDNRLKDDLRIIAGEKAVEEAEKEEPIIVDTNIKQPTEDKDEEQAEDEDEATEESDEEESDENDEETIPEEDEEGFGKPLDVPEDIPEEAEESSYASGFREGDNVHTLENPTNEYISVGRQKDGSIHIKAGDKAYYVFMVDGTDYQIAVLAESQERPGYYYKIGVLSKAEAKELIPEGEKLNIANRLLADGKLEMDINSVNGAKTVLKTGTVSFTQALTYKYGDKHFKFSLLETVEKVLKAFGIPKISSTKIESLRVIIPTNNSDDPELKISTIRATNRFLNVYAGTPYLVITFKTSRDKSFKQYIKLSPRKLNSEKDKEFFEPIKAFTESIKAAQKITGLKYGSHAFKTIIASFKNDYEVIKNNEGVNEIKLKEERASTLEGINKNLSEYTISSFQLTQEQYDALKRIMTPIITGYYGIKYDKQSFTKKEFFEFISDAEKKGYSVIDLTELDEDGRPTFVLDPPTGASDSLNIAGEALTLAIDDKSQSFYVIRRQVVKEKDEYKLKDFEKNGKVIKRFLNAIVLFGGDGVVSRAMDKIASANKSINGNIIRVTRTITRNGKKYTEIKAKSLFADSISGNPLYFDYIKKAYQVLHNTDTIIRIDSLEQLEHFERELIDAGPIMINGTETTLTEDGVKEAREFANIAPQIKLDTLEEILSFDDNGDSKSGLIVQLDAKEVNSSLTTQDAIFNSSDNFTSNLESIIGTEIQIKPDSTKTKVEPEEKKTKPTVGEDVVIPSSDETFSDIEEDEEEGTVTIVKASGKLKGIFSFSKDGVVSLNAAIQNAEELFIKSIHKYYSLFNFKNMPKNTSSKVVIEEAPIVDIETGEVVQKGIVHFEDDGGRKSIDELRRQAKEDSFHDFWAYGEGNETDNLGAILTYKEAFEYAKRIIPSITERELLFLEQMITNGSMRHYGQYKNGIISLFNGKEGGVREKVLRHELFHKLVNEFMTEREKNSLFAKFRTEFSEETAQLNELQLEDFIADKFMEWRKDNYKAIGTVKRLFNKLLDVLNFILNKLFSTSINRTYMEDVDLLFTAIEKGFYTIRHNLPTGVTRDMMSVIQQYGGLKQYRDAKLLFMKGMYKIREERLVYDPISKDFVKGDYVYTRQEIEEVNKDGIIKDPILKLYFEFKARELSRMIDRVEEVISNTDANDQKTLDDLNKEMAGYINERNLYILNTTMFGTMKSQIYPSYRIKLNEFFTEDDLDYNSDEEISGISKEVENSERVSVERTLTNEVKDFLAKINYTKDDDETRYTKKSWVHPRYAFVKMIQLMSGLQPFADNATDKSSKFIAQLEARLKSSTIIKVSGQTTIDKKTEAVFNAIKTLYEKATSPILMGYDAGYILPKNVKFLTENSAVIINVNTEGLTKEEIDSLYKDLENIHTESEAKNDKRFKIINRFRVIKTKRLVEENGKKVEKTFINKEYTPTGEFLMKVVSQANLVNYVDTLGVTDNQIGLAINMASFMMEKAIAKDTFAAIVSVFNSLRERNIRVLDISTATGARMYSYTSSNSKVQILPLKGRYLGAISDMLVPDEDGENIEDSVELFKQAVKSIISKNKNSHKRAVMEFLEYIGMDYTLYNGMYSEYIEDVFNDIKYLVASDRLDLIGKEKEQDAEGNPVYYTAAEIINSAANSMTTNLALLTSPSIMMLRSTSVKGYDGIKKYIHVPGSSGYTILETVVQSARGIVAKHPFMNLPFFKNNIFNNGINKIFEVFEHDGISEDLYYHVKQKGRTKENRADFLARTFMSGFLGGLINLSSKGDARYSEYIFNISNKDAMPGAIVKALNPQQIKEAFKSMAKQAMLDEKTFKKMYGGKEYKQIKGTTEALLSSITEAMKEAKENNYSEEQLFDKIAEKTYDKLLSIASELTDIIIENKIHLPADLHNAKIIDDIVDKELFSSYTSISEFGKDKAYDKESKSYIRTEKRSTNTISVETKKMAKNRTENDEVQSKDYQYVISKSELVPLVMAYVANHYVNASQLTQLVVGDFNVYGSSSKIVKRLGSWFGPGTSLNINDKIGSKKKVRIGVMNDLTEGSEAMKTFLEKLEVSEEKMEELLEFFKDYNWSDSQGFMLEERRDDIRNGVSSFYETGNVLKPLITGYDSNGAPIIIKYSSVVLTDGAIKQFPALAHLRDAMRYNGLTIDERNRLKELDVVPNNQMTVETWREYNALRAKIKAIDEVVFKSGCKAHSPSIALDSGVFKKNEAFVFEPESIIEIEGQYVRLQFNPESNIESHVSNPSQLSYFLNLFDIDQPEATMAYDALANIMKNKLDVYRNIVDHNNNVDISNDKSADSSLIKKMMDKINKPGNEKLIEFMEYFALKLKLNNIADVPVIADKMITNFMSDVTNSVVDIKFEGAKLVLQTEALTGEYDAATQELQRSLNIRIIDGPEGKILVADVIIPHGMFPRKVERQIKEAISKGEDSLLFGHGQLVGFRLPSSELHSAIALNVKGFYDNRSQDFATGKTLSTSVAIMPRELVWLHGSDFDVDSLFILKRSYRINGTPIGYKKEGDTYIWDEDYENSDEYKELINSDKRDKNKYKKDLEILNNYYRNKFVEALSRSITNKHNRDRMISNIRLDIFQEDIDEIKRLKGKNYISYDKMDLSNPIHSMLAYEHSYEGASTVGIVANTIKDFAYTIRASVSRGPLKLKDQDEGGYRKLYYRTEEGKVTDFDTVEFTRELGEEFDALLNLAIDNMNEGVLPILKLGSDNMSAYMVMRAMGVPRRLALLYYQTPIMDYMKGIRTSKKVDISIAHIKDLLKEEEFNSGKSMVLTQADVEKLIQSNIKIRTLESNKLSKEDVELLKIQLAVLIQMSNAKEIANGLFELSMWFKGLRTLPVFVQDITRLFAVDEKVKGNDFGFDISRLLELPHLNQFSETLDYVKQVLENRFFLTSPELAKVHKITKALFKSPDDMDFRPEEQDALFRKEFLKYVMQLVASDPEIESSTFLRPKTTIPDRGKVAWIQNATKLLKGVTSQSALKNNKFISFLTESFDQNAHQASIKFSAGQVFELDDYVELQEAFDELVHYKIDMKTGRVYETKDLPASGMSNLQELFVKYTLLTTGYTFGYTNYNFVISPKYLEKYLRMYDYEISMFKNNISRNNINRFIIEFATKNTNLVKDLKGESIKFAQGDETFENSFSAGSVTIDGKNFYFDIAVNDEKNQTPTIGKRVYNNKASIYIKIAHVDGVSYFKKIAKPRYKYAYDGNSESLNSNYNISKSIPANYITVRVDDIKSNEIKIDKSLLLSMLKDNPNFVFHIVEWSNHTGDRSRFVKPVGKSYIKDDSTYIKVETVELSQEEENNLYQYFESKKSVEKDDLVAETIPKKEKTIESKPSNILERWSEEDSIKRRKELAEINQLLEANGKDVDEILFDKTKSIKLNQKAISLDELLNKLDPFKEYIKIIKLNNIESIIGNNKLINLLKKHTLKNTTKDLDFKNIVFINENIELMSEIGSSENSKATIIADGTIVIHLANFKSLDELKITLEHEILHSATKLQIDIFQKILEYKININNVDEVLDYLDKNANEFFNNVRIHGHGLTLNQTQAFIDIIKIYKQVVDKYRENGELQYEAEFGLEDLKEFIAYGLTDQEFRNTLNKIESKVSKDKYGLFTDLINKLIQLFGINSNTVAYDLLNNSFRLMSNELNFKVLDRSMVMAKIWGDLTQEDIQDLMKQCGG